jgi:hypothetical protein
VEHVQDIVGESKAKRPLARTSCKWMDNIKVDIREIGWDDFDWIDLAQDSNC